MTQHPNDEMRRKNGESRNSQNVSETVRDDSGGGASFGPIFLFLQAAKDIQKADSAHPGRHQSTESRFQGEIPFFEDSVDQIGFVR